VYSALEGRRIVIEFAGGLCLIAAVTLRVAAASLLEMRETRLACAGFNRAGCGGGGCSTPFRSPGSVAAGPYRQGVAIRTDPYPNSLPALTQSMLRASRPLGWRGTAGYAVLAQLETRNGEVSPPRGGGEERRDRAVAADESAAARALRQMRR